MVLVGAMDPFWPGDRSFRAVGGGGGGGGGGGLWPVSKVGSSARACTLPSEVYPAGRLQ